MAKIERERRVIGLKTREISKDVLMIFSICYEYSLSFTNVMKLFDISRKYFWTFLEICSPMVKMGVRKAANMRKSVDKMYAYLDNRKEAMENLTPKEEKVLEAFTWFIEDSFADGNSCVHISQFEQVPTAVGYTSKGVRVASNYEEMKKVVDKVHYIQLGEYKLYKTSKFMYYMERYSGDTEVRELDSLSVQEMLRRITDGMEKEDAKEEEWYKEVCSK